MSERTVVRDPVYLAFAAVGAVILFVAAQIVHPNRAPGWEEAIFHPINDLPGSIYQPLWLLMQAGNLVAAPLAAVIAASLRRFRLAFAIGLATVAKLQLALVVKDLWLRERPASVIEDVTRRGDASASGKAFVSGHAVIAVSLAVLITPYLPRRWRWVPWAGATLVCLGRVYVGAHLPLDVVGGAGLGLTIGCVLAFVFGQEIEPRKPTIRSGHDRGAA